MAVGTLGVYVHGLHSGEQAYASPLAFTTIVLVQFFTVMNACFDAATAFNRQLFDNRKLWTVCAQTSGGLLAHDRRPKNTARRWS